MFLKLFCDKEIIRFFEFVFYYIKNNLEFLFFNSYILIFGLLFNNVFVLIYSL